MQRRMEGGGHPDSSMHTVRGGGPAPIRRLSCWGGASRARLGGTGTGRGGWWGRRADNWYPEVAWRWHVSGVSLGVQVVGFTSRHAFSCWCPKLEDAQRCPYIKKNVHCHGHAMQCAITRSVLAADEGYPIPALSRVRISARAGQLKSRGISDSTVECLVLIETCRIPISARMRMG